MPQNIDDYYSSISSTDDAGSSTAKKRPLIKKKIKVKPKAKKIEVSPST